MSRFVKFLVGGVALMLSMTALAADPKATDTALSDNGRSDEAVLQMSQPSRGKYDSSNKCRGSFLRTEVMKVESRNLLVVKLTVVEATQQPTFRLSVQEEQDITEVRVYETLARDFVSSKNNGEGAYEYHLLPGEYTYGETGVRTVKSPLKPLANSPVRINAVGFVTDGDGVVQNLNTRLPILDTLDSLERRTMDFVVEVPDMPMQVFTVYRTMPQRRDYDEKLLDEPAQQDVLRCYHLDFRQSLVQPEQEGLECSFEPDRIPSLVRAGEWFPITVQVANRGKRQTSCLLARTFSRIPDLNGRLFYFGAIAPGATARFTRYFKIATEEMVNHAFVEIRFSDSWGILKQRLPLDLSFVH